MMKKRLPFRIALLAAAVAALAASTTACRSAKEQPQETPAPSAPSKPSAGPSGLREEMAAMQAGWKEWQTVRMGVSIKVKAPISQSVGGTLTMVRGRGIDLSLKMLGFEVARMVMTADSVYAYEKINKRLVVEPLGALLGSSQLTITDLQDLLLGRLPAATGPYALSQPSGWPADTWLITPEKRLPDGLELHFVGQGTRLAGATLFEQKGRSVTMEYAGAETTAAGTIPSSIDLEASGLPKPVAASLTYDLGRARWNSNDAVKWNLPRNARRVSGKQLLEMLTGMQ